MDRNPHHDGSLLLPSIGRILFQKNAKDFCPVTEVVTVMCSEFVTMRTPEVSMKNSIIQFISKQDGGAAMEYALMAGLLSFALFIVLLLFRTNLVMVFQSIADALVEAMNYM